MIDFTANAVRHSLRMNRPFLHWHHSVRVLQEVLAWDQNALPVVVAGSGLVDFDESDPVWRCSHSLGRNLQEFPKIVLVTRTEDAVGRETAWEFYVQSLKAERLIHLEREDRESPRDYGAAPGKELFMGRSREDEELILGMSARLTIIVGGGCHATKVANATLASGGLVIPIASTGGAAAGLRCKFCDSVGCRINLIKATERVRRTPLSKYDRWSRIRDPECRPETAVRILCQCISELP